METIKIFKALADTNRVRILNLLQSRELMVNEMVRALHLAQPLVSHHLRILAESGLVTIRRDGLWNFYALNGHSLTLLKSALALIRDESQIKQDELRVVELIKDRSREKVRLFNALASKWEKIKTSILGDFSLNTAIAERFVPVQVIADLGCGTGDLWPFIQTKAELVIGVDASPEMLREARKKFCGDGIDIRMGELEHLPLKDGEADGAVYNMVLHHLSVPSQGLNEVQRILKPAGRFVLADLKKHRNEMLRQEFGDSWLGFQKTEIEEWLTKAGFKLQSMETFAVQEAMTILLVGAEKQ